MSLEAPRSLSANLGELNGEINLQWDAVEKANAYLVEFCTEINRPEWEQVDFVSISRCTISGLEQDTTYFFRVSAVNSSMQSKCSKIVKRHIKKYSLNYKILKYENI